MTAESVAVLQEDILVDSYFAPHQTAVDRVDTRGFFPFYSTMKATTPVSSTFAAVGITHSPAAQAKHKTLEGWTFVGHIVGSFDVFVFVYCLFWRATFANPA